MSNVSMLSRDMVINGSALLYDIFRALRFNGLGPRPIRFSVWIGLFVVFFVLSAYSTPSLPLIPEQACHPFQTKAATDSRAKLPPWQMVPEQVLEPLDAG
jgi:hypothetical protein